ncbi:sensor histidine kinase [Citrobacter amalonaticus]|uniref:sensor histidine kinase n=1 Tax=Citrobacter amalonaticus TaxID=35703 RepID=UPI001A266CF3|nr:histidine kinase [Citrobacter amalonaticus]HDQ2810106.1 ATP-binding protein [Citrobacter amalonaticus]
MANFEVAARTLIHLGAELITSDAIAINELIKNAIDAKSENVNIYFISPVANKILDECAKKIESTSLLNESLISEIISSLQNNCNPNINDKVKSNFLERLESIKKLNTKEAVIDKILSINHIIISDSGHGMSKEVLENVFLTVGTGFKMHSDGSVLGNKGIGRLAMMRLGKKATITSWENVNDAYNIKFNWKEFESSDKKITDIIIPLTKVVLKKKHAEHGTRIRIYELNSEWTDNYIQKELIDGFLRRLRNPFQTNNKKFPINVYYNTYDINQRIPIKKISQELWELGQKNVDLTFDPYNEELKNNQLKIVVEGKSEGDNPPPYETRLLNLSHELDCSIEDLKKIGPFKFKLRWYNRQALKKDIKNQGLSKQSKALHTELDIWSGGVSIYRDGFRVGYSGSQSDKDWFEIDSKALKGQGFTVNRIQIIGALEITKEKNPLLQDRSNREGLLDNLQVNLVKRIISEIALPEFREAINNDKEIIATRKLDEVIENGFVNTENKLSKIRDTVSKLRKDTDDPGKKTIFTTIEEELNKVSNEIKDFGSATNYIKEQREDILELAGAGTMLHSVLHELVRSTAQTRELLEKLSKESDGMTSQLLEKLQNEIKTINVRLTQFSPLNPSARNRKSTFDLIEAINIILSGYNKKLIDNNIKVYFTKNGEAVEGKYKVSMVRGFFSIAIENLLSNSIYWLMQDKLFTRLPSSTERAIYIDLDTQTNVITFSDTGPGISINDRERIFNAGFTTKKSEKDGKGFGLFIAREVTKHYYGNLYLDLDTDEDNRLRKFVLELPKDL